MERGPAADLVARLKSGLELCGSAAVLGAWLVGQLLVDALGPDS